MEYEIVKPSRCLECGHKMEYGRPDKKFCCPECRNTYNNRIKSSHRSWKLKVDNILERNYKVLDDLLKHQMDDISLTEASLLGFNASFVTAHGKSGCHTTYSIYDITFILSSTRMFNIHRSTVGFYVKQI